MPWELNGNANTDPNTNFLGTTDQEPFVIKTNGNEAVRVDAKGNVGIGTPIPSNNLEIAKLEIAAQAGLKIVGFEPYLTLVDSDRGTNVRIQAARGDLGILYTQCLILANPLNGDQER